MGKKDTGARALFHATNAQYTFDAAIPLADPTLDGIHKADESRGRALLVEKGSESTENEKLLRDHRKQHWELFARHLENIFTQEIKA